MTTGSKLRSKRRRAGIPLRRRIQRTAAQLEVLDDAKLIELCFEWDEDAWREFRRRYEPALREYCYVVAGDALTNDLASDAVEDILGDFYVRIVQAQMHKLRFWHASTREASALTWLREIVGGIAIDHVRAHNREANAQAVFAALLRDGACGLRRGADWEAAQDRALASPQKKRRAKRPEKAELEVSVAPRQRAAA